jgi:hypothetical protein
VLKGYKIAKKKMIVWRRLKHKYSKKNVAKVEKRKRKLAACGKNIWKKWRQRKARRKRSRNGWEERGWMRKEEEGGEGSGATSLRREVQERHLTNIKIAESFFESFFF